MTGQTSDTQYWVALNRIPGVGRVRYQLLEKHFGRMENAWRATPAASERDLRPASRPLRSRRADERRRVGAVRGGHATAHGLRPAGGRAPGLGPGGARYHHRKR